MLLFVRADVTLVHPVACRAQPFTFEIEVSSYVANSFGQVQSRLLVYLVALESRSLDDRCHRYFAFCDLRFTS